jgi:1,4-dihydroxy-6-naphthoate synthase
VIHEHRFTFERDGLFCLQDLGAYWESSMHSPIPLGVIVARKSLGETRIRSIENTIQESLKQAWNRKDLITPFIRKHAQDTDVKVMQSHIQMFVNDFSMKIGEQGHSAIGRLEALAKSQHLL